MSLSSSLSTADWGVWYFWQLYPSSWHLSQRSSLCSWLFCCNGRSLLAWIILLHFPHCCPWPSQAWALSHFLSQTLQWNSPNILFGCNWWTFWIICLVIEVVEARLHSCVIIIIYTDINIPWPQQAYTSCHTLHKWMLAGTPFCYISYSMYYCTHTCRSPSTSSPAR